jgi:hypothetical protein
MFASWGEQSTLGGNKNTVAVRATRWGKFLPIGQFFSLGSFSKNFEVCTILSGNNYIIIILTKLCWATSRAIFSNTHLVTLVAVMIDMLFHMHVFPYIVPT